jgi:hypothetical protein
VAGILLRAFAVRAGEPLAEITESAASTKAIIAFRHTGECAENPEQFQCSPAPVSLPVPRRVQACLITRVR